MTFAVYSKRALLAAALMSVPCLALADTTITFADGVGGYTGATDIYVAREGMIGGETNLAATSTAFQDRVIIDSNDAGTTTYGAALYKFVDVFGAGVGQIDLGYEIVSASLQITSGAGGNDRTNSDPRVYGVTGPTSIATTFQDLSGFNATEQEGSDAYIYGGGSSLVTPYQSFVDSHGGDTPISYDVSQYIRSVSAGKVAPADLALVATQTSTDGWGVVTSLGVAASRPTLAVTYNENRIQNSVVLGSGQAVMAQVGNQGNDITTEITTGFISIDYALDQEADPDLPDEIIDPTGALEQQFDQGLVKFDLTGVFPSDAILQQARLVTPTRIGGSAASGDTNNVDAGISVRQMLVDWDLEADPSLPTLPSEFGSQAGIQVSEGEASAAFVDMNGNFFDGSSVGNAGFDSLSDGEEYVFDVTGIVQAWLDGDENYGFVISKFDTDGWQIDAQGIELQLDFTTPVPEPSSLALLGLGSLLIARRRRG